MSLGSFRIRKLSLKSSLLAGVWAVLLTPLLITLLGHAAVTSNLPTPPVLYPLQNTGTTAPLAMLLLSRDDQLFFRAFSDYSDLSTGETGDTGALNTTYTDTFKYAGYFDPGLCYTYSGGQFAAAAQATGTNGHTCSSQWSGNFLNWLTMSRIDEERFVLYGGRRSTDTATSTVLQRAFVPNDAHAWAKVYTDNGSFTPNSGTYSYCNATMGSVGTDSSADNTSQPLLRVASGTWAAWASSERTQCQIQGVASASGAGTGNLGGPAQGQDFPSAATDYAVKVKVCDPSSGAVDANGNPVMESFCQKYTDSSGGVHYKPVGLLQQFGTSIRFGLMTGTWKNPRAGGVLRRNIGFIEGNGDGTCAGDARNEVDMGNGEFCYIAQNTPAMEGVINSLDNFRVYGWTPNSSNDQSYADCSTYGTQNRQGGTAGTTTGNNKHLNDPGNPGASNGYHCAEWGNPLGEMYAEALRYIEHFDSDKTTALSPTSAFTTGLTVGGTGDSKDLVPNLPAPKWLDPYSEKSGDGGAPYCAQCNIVVLSTGSPTFDANPPEIPTVPDLGLQEFAATNKVGAYELGTGGASTRQYLVGRVLGAESDLTVGQASPVQDTSQDVCTQQTINSLALVRGICPDTPSTEGSYDIAGLAFEAWTSNLRPDLQGTHNIETYTIQLSEPLPSFAVGASHSGSSGQSVTVIPGCQAKDTAVSNAPYRACGFMNLQVGPITNPDTKITYGLPTAADGTSGSYTVYWMDSPYGADYDVDAVQVISYCVGSACLTSNVQAYMCKTFNSNDPTTPPSGNSSSPGSATICNKGQIKQNPGSGAVLIRTEMVYDSTYMPMNLGFTAAGPSNTQNGFYPGTNNTGNGTFLNGTGGDTGTATNTKTSYNWQVPEIVSLTTGPSQQNILPSPLFLAAKYGGFQPAFNASGAANAPTPNGTGTWDAVNNVTGAAGGDGLPDNYFLVRNPNQLKASLARSFNSILQRAGSGTAAAVVANHVNGIGVAYRATYQPQLIDSNDPTVKVTWTGALDTLWVDSYGLLRENGSAGTPGSCSSGCTLSDYTTDPIVVFTTDPTTNQPGFLECVPVTGTVFDPSAFDPTNTAQVTCSAHSDLTQLQTVWNAESQLWAGKTSTFATGLATQRSYGSNASTGRCILTWIDKNKNGVVDAGEMANFVWSGATSGTTGSLCGSGPTGIAGFSGAVTTSKSKGVTTTTTTGNFGFLNSDNPTEAQNVINWIRGVEVSGMRGRTLTADCVTANIPNCPLSPTQLTLRLGDIVNSTPLVIGAPSENYDLLYGDSSYTKFKAYYHDRRQVAYVGADDGMLHAFNGGFFNASTHSLTLQGPSGSYNSSATADPLGSELWAYVPGNLLAHLRWLTDPAYAHVFYVDGSPIATDAKIFSDDGDCSSVAASSQCHPGGWGTILVVPFRLGGGDIKVPVAIDPTKAWTPSSCDGTTTTNCTWQESFSSYVVLDVSDPEKPPVVLAELSPASTVGGSASTSGGTTSNTLGTQSYTTAIPAFAVLRNPTTSSPNQFMMFIGSGPSSASQSTVTSSAPLRIYAYDLAALACQAGDGAASCSGSGAPVKTFNPYNSGAGVAQAKNSFAGDLIASDFNLNDLAESVYFGSVRDDQTNSPRDYTGSLWKIALNESTDPSTWSVELMYDAKLPITIRPSLGLDSRTAPEVYVGTGRLLDTSDLQTTGQQQILGMIDPDTFVLPTGDPQSDFTLPLTPPSGTNSGDLLDVTNIGVCVTIVTGTCDTVGTLVNGPTGTTTFNNLQQLFSTSKAKGGKAGFLLKLTASGGTTPSERVISSQALLGGVLITNAYTPGTDSCTTLGTGREFATDYETGTANPDATSTNSAFGANSNGTGKTSVSLGPGLPSAPSLHAGAGNQSNSKSITACTQTSTGAIICQKVTSLLPVTSGEVSWREPLDQ